MSKWAKDWLLKRNSLSQINLKELKLEPGDWYSYLRIDSEAYLELLQKVMPRVRKFDSVIRRVITPRETMRRDPPILSDRKKLQRPEILCCDLTPSFRSNYS